MYVTCFWCTFLMGYKADLGVSETLERTQRSGHVPCPQSFPTSWHSAGLGINRGARCAPRMHVCRVPISEYIVIGLPEGLDLTFRLQVAGHSTAHPSPLPQLLTPFSLISVRTNRQSDKITRSGDHAIWLKAPEQQLNWLNGWWDYFVNCSFQGQKWTLNLNF